MTEASRRGVARLVADAAHGIEVVVERHGAPVAAVVGVDRFAELMQLARRPARPRARDRPRPPTTTVARTPLDDVVDAFGRARRG